MRRLLWRCDCWAHGWQGESLPPTVRGLSSVLIHTCSPREWLIIDVLSKSITALSGSCLFSKAVAACKKDTRLGVSRAAPTPGVSQKMWLQISRSLIPAHSVIIWSSRWFSQTSIITILCKKVAFYPSLSTLSLNHLHANPTAGVLGCLWWLTFLMDG